MTTYFKWLNLRHIRYSEVYMSMLHFCQTMGANLKKLRLVVLLRGFTELTCTTAVLIEDSIAVNAT